jgi:hypothetical protein
MKNEEIFSKRVAGLFGAIGLASLLFTVYLFASAEDTPQNVAKPSALSRSALGYQAFARFLASFQIDVYVRRFSPEAIADQRNVLLLFEPEEEHLQNAVQKTKQALALGATVVLSLPKWSYSPNLLKPGWIEAPTQCDRAVPNKVLAALFELQEEEFLARPGSAKVWPLLLGGIAPTITAPQFFSKEIPVTPIVASEYGVLIGKTEAFGGELYVISDPDLLNTHGIVQGDNAVLAYRLFLEEINARGVVFDEVIHGLQQTPSLWRELTTAPLWWLTFHLLGILVLGVWAGLFRFGAHIPLPSRLAPGKEALIESAASLLASRAELWPSLERYHHQILFEVAAACMASTNKDVLQHLPALSRLAKQRNIAVDIEAITKEIQSTNAGAPKRALVLAGLLHRWRQEMLRGTQ